MKRHLLFLLSSLFLAPVTSSCAHAETRGSFFYSKKWYWLFDGKSIDQWKNVTGLDITRGWNIVDGSLKLEPGRIGGDIITKDIYDNFELTMEFKLTESGNTGVKYQVMPLKNMVTGKVDWIGFEYQLIDDYKHPEIRNNPEGKMSTGAAYLLYPPSNKKLKNTGVWNKLKIVVKGNDVEHWLNGRKVVSFTKGTPDFLSKVNESKFKDYPEFGRVAKGHILLQDHGDGASFRNIRIRKL